MVNAKTMKENGGSSGLNNKGETMKNLVLIILVTVALTGCAKYNHVHPVEFNRIEREYTQYCDELLWEAYNKLAIQKGCIDRTTDEACDTMKFEPGEINGFIPNICYGWRDE